ncbi:MAG TPA: TetR/AcrR family transcriptional regulator [Pseudonocardiaceae bacterium]|jgi:AcrR family transcriptional regulator|nr:TetR/AcrR family transcriptional regulator [Pseudonocardiaceae bacterium]
MGVTKANVYYYFHTRIEILEALLDRGIAAFDTMLATVVQRHGAGGPPKGHSGRRVPVGRGYRRSAVTPGTL